MWAGGRGPGMTSSVSHSESAPAGESRGGGGGYGIASCSRVGTNREKASIHRQGAAVLLGTVAEEWARKVP